MMVNAPEWWDNAVSIIREKMKKWPTERISVGTSGGRSSATLALLMREAIDGDRVDYVFANTGREDEATLVFVDGLSKIHDLPVVWLEYEPPPIPGDRPGRAGYRVVDYATADRAGGPMLAMLGAIEAYRYAENRGGSIAPNPRSRICTAYLKIKVMQRWQGDKIGKGGEWVEAVGLRADEPDRVSRLTSDRRDVTSIAPLAWAGVTKQHVAEFWSGREGDLGLMEPWGNCDGCFMKDEADLADIFMERPEVGEWWARLEARYAAKIPPSSKIAQAMPTLAGVESMRGKGATYGQIVRELPARMRVRSAIKEGENKLSYLSRWPADKRLWAQETRAERERVACSCEGAVALAEDDGPLLRLMMMGNG